MRRDYIEDIIVLLENVRNNLREQKIKTKFDLTEWVNKNECGTTACAIGHAALDPLFQKRGLRLMWEDPSPIKSKTIKSPDDIDRLYDTKKYGDPAFSYIYFYIKYGDLENFDAVKSFFRFQRPGIASILFSVSSYPSNNKSLRNVIARLKYLLKYGEDRLYNKFR